MSTIAVTAHSEDLVAPSTTAAAAPVAAPAMATPIEASATDGRRDSLASALLADSQQPPIDLDRRAEVPRTERLPGPAEHIFEALSESMRTEATNLKAMHEALPAMMKRRCPECGAVEMRRSRTRSTLERLARAINMYPFRCVSCHHRFLAPGRS
jgi:hypothetical protein